MRYARVLFWLTCLLPFIVVYPARPGTNPTDEGITVGRISHVEGKLLRYVPEEKDWEVTAKDAPFGLNDALYSNQAGKAEFILPNGTWVRIGSNTQIQAVALRDDLSEIDVASGVARFYNNSEDAVIKSTTPFGYVVAPPGCGFDLYVGDQSVEAVALHGNVEFVPENGNSKYNIEAGSRSIISDGREVSRGNGDADPDWDSWNDARDRLWTKRLQVRGDSVKYIPESLDDNAPDLDANGIWERVPYEGGSYYFWRPTYVAPGWAPFTVGRWVDWGGDDCWIPDEPFGYVTHHYGNWIFINDYWYWVPPPPVVRVRAYVGLPIPGFWYPGRVAAIYSDSGLGWIPLAPGEPYYSRHRWGPDVVINTNINTGPPLHDLRTYRNIDHAVLVPRGTLYTTTNYNKVRITRIDRTTIINNYRATPLLSGASGHNAQESHMKYALSNAPEEMKPHSMVMERIHHNRIAASNVKNQRAQDVRTETARLAPGRALSANQASIPPLRITNKFVHAPEMNRPASELELQQKELGKKGWTSPGKTADGRYRSGEGPRDRVGTETQTSAGLPDQRGPQEDSNRPGRVRPGKHMQSELGENNHPLAPRYREKDDPGSAYRPTRPVTRTEDGALRSPRYVEPKQTVLPESPVSEGTRSARPQQKLSPNIPQNEDKQRRVIREQQFPQRRVEPPPQPATHTQDLSRHRPPDQLEQRRRRGQSTYQPRTQVQEPRREVRFQEPHPRHVEQKPQSRPQAPNRKPMPSQQPQPRPQVQVQRPVAAKPRAQSSPSNKGRATDDSKKKRRGTAAAKEQPNR